MTPVNWAPDVSQLRAFGRGFAVLFGAIGVAKMFWPFSMGLERDVRTGAVLLGVGLAGGLWALTGHKSARVLFVAWTGLGVVLGFFVSKILFAVVYFGLITPMALFFRTIGRDQLNLRKPEGTTYWRPLTRREGGYERLF